MGQEGNGFVLRRFIAAVADDQPLGRVAFAVVIGNHDVFIGEPRGAQAACQIGHHVIDLAMPLGRAEGDDVAVDFVAALLMLGAFLRLHCHWRARHHQCHCGCCYEFPHHNLPLRSLRARLVA